MNQPAVTCRVFPLPHCISVPTQARPGDAGWDVYATQDMTLRPGDIKKMPLGFQMALPMGFEAQLRPRSGMGAKGVTIPNAPGTIDAGYRGEVCVLLHNTRDSFFEIAKGDRVAQMVIKQVPPVQMLQVASEDDLPASERGAGGFGSTGK